MDFWLRAAKRTRWREGVQVGWPHTGEIPADTLTDWKTDHHALSLWKINEDRSNLARVIAALAFNRDRVGAFDYLLLPCDAVDPLRLKIVAVVGETLDDVANKSWHFDAIELSCRHLLDLLRRYWDANPSVERMRDREIAQKIDSSITAGHLNPNGKLDFVESVKRELTKRNKGGSATI